MLAAKTKHGPSGATSLQAMASLDERKRVEELELAAMSAAFRDYGGIMGSGTVAECLRWRLPQPISQLARWIVARSIITLDSNGCMLIPMFQFELRDMSLLPAFTVVFRELRDTFDDRQVALWFATPNPRLGARTPVECLARNEQQVAEVACADCFDARN